jgi:periplasmic copper chaperone A
VAARVAAVALFCLLFGCSGEPGSGAPGDLVVLDAWTRPTPPGSTEAAVYLRVVNGSEVADQLVGGQSDRCMSMLVHETAVDADGVSRMTLATPSELTVPVGGTLELEPSGLHLMCTGLASPLAVGERWSVRLEMAHLGVIGVEVVVEDRV